MHHPTDRIAHTTTFVTPVVEHWLEREIAQWVHPMKDGSDDPSTMSERSYHAVGGDTSLRENRRLKHIVRYIAGNSFKPTAHEKHVLGRPFVGFSDLVSLCLFSCLYHNVQARCPGHTPQLSVLSVYDSKLIIFVNW